MFLSLAIAALTLQHLQSFPHEQQCGSPLVQSQLYVVVPGRLIPIEKDRLRVQRNDNRKASKSNRYSFRNLLTRRFGEPAEILVTQSEALPNKIQAKVMMGGQTADPNVVPM